MADRTCGPCSACCILPAIPSPLIDLTNANSYTGGATGFLTSGLSTSIINRMLMSPQLPQRVRTKIVEYVQEKTSGLHGHNQKQLRKFVSRLLIKWPEIERRQGVRSSPLPRSCHALAR
jgi:hypothetical protein